MLSLKLAYKNLIGAGLRTWLNVAVLSLVYIIIIGTQGIFNGMNEQASRAVIKDEIGGGQYWHRNYDPYDPLAFDDSHGRLSDKIVNLIKSKEATPILIRQAAIYPEGRIQTVLLKGIDPGQQILGIPSAKLGVKDKVLPVLIGTRMAKSASLKMGDFITIRWRDVNGTFDAVEGKVVAIMKTTVPGIDNGQLWIPLKELQKMTRLDDEATLVVVGRHVSGQVDTEGWKFKNHEILLQDIHELIKTKMVSSAIMYVILIFLAMLAIFDTQVLAIFRRRKEIGTMIAMGMTPRQVISLFTLEGAMHGILAIGVAAIYGIPLLGLFAEKGLSLPQATESFGFALNDRLYPSYSLSLVLGTVLLMMLIVTIVSFVPSHRISRLKPTDALKGKLS